MIVNFSGLINVSRKLILIAKVEKNVKLFFMVKDINGKLCITYV